LEAQLGKVSIKEGTASPRGHNGLKSVQASLGQNRWWRVGVGIGRPESRDAAVVSKYVLRKMTYGEEKAMDDAAINVLFALRKIAEGNA
jgi:PTH1 family peptidyl-tRNA hydrolase